MGEFVRNVILMGSGAFVMMLVILGIRAIRDRRWGHVGLDFACANMIGLILEAVFKVSEVPPDLRAWSFLTAGIIGLGSAIYIVAKGER